MIECQYTEASSQAMLTPPCHSTQSKNESNPLTEVNTEHDRSVYELIKNALGTFKSFRIYSLNSPENGNIYKGRGTQLDIKSPEICKRKFNERSVIQSKMLRIVSIVDRA